MSLTGFRRIWALLALALTIFPVDGQGQTMYVVYGNVRLPNGSPAPRATVRLTGQSGIDRQTFTDDMGRYEIRDLPRGRYFLSAANPAAPEQLTDPAEVDINRLGAARVLVHLFFRSGSTTESRGERKGSSISAAEAAQRIPKQAHKAFEQALRHRADQKLEKSLESFTRAIELFPAYFQAYAERGHLQIALGHVADASSDFGRALALNDRYEPALRGAGLCRFQERKFEDAVTNLNRAVAEEPGNAVTYLFLGMANLALDRREPARYALQKALAIDRKGAARAHVHLANLAIKENRPQDAIRELQAYLDAQPHTEDAEKLRAIIARLELQGQR
jgi:tetratricopeptide (TPR) repeat protein